MSEGIFKLDKSPVSERWVIFEDDGISGWLYLTNPNEKKPIADCWIYNRIEAPASSEIKNFKNGPPPASNEYAGPYALVAEPDELKIRFKWSNDGNSVALILDGNALGYIVTGSKVGFSKNLTKIGPWGNLFDQSSFDKLFE